MHVSVCVRVHVGIWPMHLDIHQNFISHNSQVRLRAKAVSQQHIKIAVTALWVYMYEHVRI